MKLTAEEIIEYLEHRHGQLIANRDSMAERLKDASPYGEMATLLDTFIRRDARVAEDALILSEIHRLEWVKSGREGA